MFPKIIVCFVVAMFAFSATSEARNVEITEMQPSETRSAMSKRLTYDPVCQGFHDMSLFNQLETVCSDCYNLYRQPHIIPECRRDCYTSVIFEACMRDLMMHEYIDEYKQKAAMVAGKK